MLRRSSSFNTGRIDHLYQDLHEPEVRFLRHYGDMTDATNLIRIVQEAQPMEIYNLAAQSHVKVSFETAEYTANSDALGTLRLLEAIRILRMEDKGQVLPSLHIRTVWRRLQRTAERNDAVSSPFAIRDRKTLRLLDHCKLSGSVWNACLERHPLQP